MKNHHEPKQYRSDIDGLRGIAVIAVILFHLNENWLPGGFTGVDIFFVISGYVVTSSILNRQSSSVWDYFLGFYARRVKRIFPALIVCIMGSVFLTSLFIPAEETHTLLRSAIWALIGSSNNFFIRHSLDYFTTDITLNPFLHTWSLGVEEQFYLVFPILILLVYGLKRPIETKSNPKLWFLASTVFLSAVLCFWLTFTNPTWAYYFMPSRFWELGAGALLYILLEVQGLKHKLNTQVWLYLPLQASAVLLLGAGLLLTDSRYGFPFPWAGLAVLGTVIFIASGSTNKSLVNQLASSSILVFIGKISYSLYLWHWTIFTLFRWTVSLESFSTMASALLLTFAFACASYFWVEKPFRELRTSDTQNWKPLSAGLGAVFLAVGIVYGVDKNKSLLEQVTLRKYPIDQQAYPVNWVEPTPNFPQIEGYPQITFENCMSPREIPYSSDKVKLNLCVTQPDSAQVQTIFLIGDSHAFHLMPMIREILKRDKNIRLLTTWRFSCIVSDSLDLMNGKELANCKEFTIGEMNKARKLLKPGDLVLISSRLNRHLSGISSYTLDGGDRLNNALLDGIKIDQATKMTEYAQSLARIAKNFSAMGVRTVLWVDTPEMKRRPLTCTDILTIKIPKSYCAPEKVTLEKMQQAVVGVFKTAQLSAQDIYIFNPNDTLAPDGEFKFINDQGLFLMEDQSHMSQVAGRMLATPFYSFLQSNQLLKR